MLLASAVESATRLTNPKRSGWLAGGLVGAIHGLPASFESMSAIAKLTTGHLI